jgi:signal transduction histidine kinase
MKHFFKILVLSLFLNIYSSYSQNSNNKFAKQISAYAKLSNEQLFKNDSIARDYAFKMLELINSSKKHYKKGEALYLIAQSYTSKSSVKALDYFKQATIYLEKNESKLVKDSYFNQATIHTKFSEFPEALKLALQSLEYNQINKIETNIQRDMSFIGYINDRMYEFKKSIKWNRKSLVLARKLKDTSAIARCFGRIGIAFDELAEKDNFNIKLFDSALYYNKKAAKYSELAGDLGFARTTYSNIGNSYSKLNKYDKAEEYTLKSLAVSGFEAGKGVTLVNLGKIYLETGRYEEAKKILDSAMQNTKQQGTRKYQLEAYYRFHELDVKKSNYKSALKNYIAYKTIEDSLLNETKTRQIVEVRERYKTAEKERLILIQRADLAEQSLTIQERNYQLFGLIGLALILSLIGYLFYSQQKLKNKQLQKENELKDALIKIETQNKLQEQRLRISRDLHDNIGAQLTFIISSIDNLKYGFNIKDEKLTHKLDTISEFTSETIYELRDTIWAMNKDEVSLEDLETRIANYIDKAKKIASKTNFEFKIDKLLDIQKTFSSVKGMNIYRIIQEAMHNSLKYADASIIDVQINKLNNKVIFKVSDNGKGFNVDTIEKGNGLLNIKKRANNIQAHVKIHSKDSQGTIITLTV